MKNKPLISVIITYYKKKKFIKRTLKSIFNQTYKNFEVIFIFDDNDTEDLNYVMVLLNQFEKKKLIVNNKNFGVARSRNLAIKNSKGKYLAFIDSDDIWKKNKLYKQLNYMEKNLLDFSFTSYSIIDEYDKIQKHKRVKFDAVYSKLVKSNFIGLSTVMANRRIISDLNFPKLNTQEDFALWLKLARKGIKLKHLKQILSLWRDSKNSLSSNTLSKLKDAFRLYYFHEKKNLISSIFSVIVLSYNKLIKSLN